MSIRKTIVTAVTIVSLLCLTGWAQRGRGPQGEFYPEMPSPTQLADVYGTE